MDSDLIQEAIEIGERNKEIIELARNWCGHIGVEIQDGIGLVEQSTGLPIGMRSFRCPHAAATGMAGINLKSILLDFYDRNCKNCKERWPVRLPNLTQLLAERDAEAERCLELDRFATQQEAARVGERDKHRQVLRAGGDSARSGIFDLLERLDHSQGAKESKILVETARAAPEKFDAGVQEVLFELAESGGWARTEASLEALSIIDSDRHKLTESALKALSRFEATSIAGSIVARWLQPSNAEYLLAALPALIYLASPSRVIFHPSSPEKPEPLLAAYQLFPEIVLKGIQALLKEPDKDLRIRCCMAIRTIIQADHDFGPKVADSLIRSMGLPDDPYNEGYARDAASKTLALAMTFRPKEIDERIQHGFAGLSDTEASSLFMTYTWMLQPPYHYEEKPNITPAHEFAFRRIVDVLAEHPNDERFGEAAVFLRDQGINYPSLIDEHTEMLLGAAALIASELETPYSPLLDPRPNDLKALEALSRETNLSIALDAIARALGLAAFRNPNKSGIEIVQLLKSMEEKHPYLRKALVKSIGIFGRNREGLKIALPALYSSMMDRSQLVRAEGVGAYKEIAKDAAEELPDLVHQILLVLLSDPYVIVHRAAVKALREVEIPGQFIDEAITRLVQLVNAYSASRRNDALLSDCIKVFMRICKRANLLNQKIFERLISVIYRMRSREATELVRYYRRNLKDVPGYADLLVKLLKDPDTNDYHLSEIVEVLATVPQKEIFRLSEEIKIAERLCAQRRVRLTMSILEILSIARAWKATAEVAKEAVSRLKDTQWDRPRKLRATSWQLASELELAAAEGNIEAVISCAEELQKAIQELEKDEKEHSTVRSPIFGFKVQGESD